MVIQNSECTAVIDIDESYVLGEDDKEFDVVFNPRRYKNSDGYSALCITAKTEKTLKIAVICEYSSDFSALLHGKEISITCNRDAMIFDLGNGNLLHYEENTVKDEFDFSEIEKMI